MASSTTVQMGTAASSYPQNRTISYVDPTTVALPSVGVKTLDPTWGTYYTRVTNGTVGGHQYATHLPVNSDGTYYWDERNADLLSTSDWAVVNASWSMPNDPIWAWTDPDKMWDVRNGNEFMYQNVAGTRTTLKTFTGYAAMRMGFGDGAQSRDDRWFLFTGTFGGQLRLMRWDKQTDTLVTRDITNLPNNYKMSPTGAYCVVNYESNDGSGNEEGVQLYDNSLTRIRQLNDNGDHGDVGWDDSGHEIYACSYNGMTGGNANVYAYRLDQSTSALDVGRLLPQDGTGQHFQQGHVSMQNEDRRGWVYLSSFKYSASAPGRGQAIAVPTDGSAFADGNPVQVFGFHRSDSDITSGSDPAYDREPHACVSRDGTKVYIRSKWAITTAVDQAYHGFILSAT